MTREQIIEAIKAMTVLELNELVKACEEEFGVSAAAPVAVVGAAGAAAAASCAIAVLNDRAATAKTKNNFFIVVFNKLKKLNCFY